MNASEQVADSCPFLAAQSATPRHSVGFSVPGQPVAKGRPKFARQGGFVRAYTPEKTVNYETLVKIAAAEAMEGDAPMKGPLTLDISLGVTIPKSTPKKDRARISTGYFLPVKKPDVDNVLKAISDAMNGIVYEDDAQLVDVRIRKRYSECPGAYVTVRWAVRDAA